MKYKAVDNVNHPSHYQTKKIEVIDVIDEFDMNFNLGNTIKYVLRHKHKGNPIQDLEKAMWYLRREIEKLKVGVEDEKA